MLFTQLRFAVFFAVAFSVYWGLTRNGWRKTWLLACSYYFYGAWDWRFLGLILLSTLVDYWAGAYVAKAATARGRKLGLGLSLLANLGLLGFFKYYNFFVESACELFTAIGLPASPHTLAIILPVGISFYTFQTLSYTLDVYYGRIQPCRNLRDFAFFVAFFPQLVAGPIVRARDFLPQLEEARRWRDVAVRSSIAVFFFGFVKKAIVSDNVALLTDAVFSAPESYSVADLWLAVGLYGVQIYCDFSGYTDMAIGAAGMLGYTLCLNFNFPYFSVSVTDFWRRWHISMMSWFRDYVYIAFGGNRISPVRTYVNLLLTFFLAGLWHGAQWNFVLFGLFNGVFLMVERWGQRSRGFDPFKKRWWGRAYMLWVIAMSYVLFRNPDISSAWRYCKLMYWSHERTNPLAADPRWWLAVLGFGLVHWLMWKRFGRRFFAALPPWGVAALLGALVALLLPLLPADYKPFIYFQF